MSDFKLMFSHEPQPKLENDPYRCKFHAFAKRNDFVIVLIKKTKTTVIRCGYCEREKDQNKRERTREWNREKEAVTPYYVKRCLVVGSKLKMSDIPDELVEAKQAVTKLDRMMKPIKRCTRHGQLYRDDVIKNGREKGSGKLRFKCRKCMKEQHAKHYELNKAKVLAYQKKYKEENLELVRESHRKSNKKYAHKYVEQERARARRADQKSARTLDDRYIKKQLVKKNGLSMHDIPDSLIACKRAVMQLKRSIRVKTDQNRINQLEEKLNGKDTTSRLENT